MKNKKENANLFMRQGPDTIVMIIKRFIQASWCLTVVALVLACAAMPIVKDLFNNVFETQFYSTWNYTFLEIDFYLSILIFIISATVLLLSTLRQRRRTDRYSLSMVVIGVLSAISIIIYLIFF